MFHRVAVVALIAMAMLQGGCTATGKSTAATVRDGVFIHIKSGPSSAHSVLMGLRMAQIMAADHDVLVYFDVDGINVVMQGAPELNLKPFGSAQALLQDLLAKKVPVYACPGCLAALGKTTDQLHPGVQVAQKEAFFSFTRGRILTLDY